MKKVLFLLTTILCVLVSCSDETATLGTEMMPTTDLLTSNIKTYDVATESYPVGNSVLARSGVSYLGRYTDTETGTTVTSDFLSEFYCPDNFGFPDSVCDDSITQCDLELYISDFVGDSLSAFKLSVYPLDTPLNSDEEYYTDLDPTKYYDETKEPITTKWFTISDRSVSDSIRNSKGYINHISIKLPQFVGQDIYDAYRKDTTLFAQHKSWSQSGLVGSKGFYFKLENGDGAMASIYISRLNLRFRYYDEGYECDTLGFVHFAATDEVVQSTRFENKNIQTLIDDTDATYLKTPAGIFTLATLPIDEMEATDTINSAKLTFKRYNDKTQSDFKLKIPKTVLLVRLDDYLNEFFENYSISNGKTSYVTGFNSNSNTYTFSNISRLVSVCLSEKREGKCSPNWNKVLLIPVEATYDTNKQLIKLNHDFSLGSARLVGGVNGGVQMEVVYSRY